MKVLLIIDCQNDFCPGGSLAVENGDRIIPIINKLSNSGQFDKIIATQDWHPENHISFASSHKVEPFTMVGKEMVWPEHCKQSTKGAELRPSLDQSPIKFIIRKGMRLGVDSYSAFLENDKNTKTGLCNIICEKDVKPEDVDIYIVGIATDVCVLNTALDARVLNWEGRVFVVEDACAAVTPEGGVEAIERMRSEGIIIINSEEIL